MILNYLALNGGGYYKIRAISPFLFFYPFNRTYARIYIYAYYCIYIILQSHLLFGYLYNYTLLIFIIYINTNMNIYSCIFLYSLFILYSILYSLILYYFIYSLYVLKTGIYFLFISPFLACKIHLFELYGLFLLS